MNEETGINDLCWKTVKFQSSLHLSLIDLCLYWKLSGCVTMRRLLRDRNVVRISNLETDRGDVFWIEIQLSAVLVARITLVILAQDCQS